MSAKHVSFRYMDNKQYILHEGNKIFINLFNHIGNINDTLNAIQQQHKSLSINILPLDLEADLNALKATTLKNNYAAYDKIYEIAYSLTKKDLMRTNHFLTLPHLSTEISASLNANPKPKLFVRIGCVEIMNLRNFLFDNHNFLNSVKSIVQQINAAANHDFMYHLPMPTPTEAYVKQMMTHAGFYSDYSTESATLFCNEYLDGLINSDALIDVPWLNRYLYKVNQYVYDRCGKSHKLVIFERGLGEEYDVFADQDILLVSAFGKHIQRNYDEGKIFKLYSNFEIKPYKLVAIDSYMSVFPHRPHGSWKETFEQLKRDIDVEFSKRKFSLFIPSCGCYGIPLCNYVFKKYAVTSIYAGNYVNFLFGILQNTTMGYHTQYKKILENWIPSDLEKYFGATKIEGGRYVYTR